MECGLTNFIMETQIENLKLCDELIQFHKNSPFKIKGMIKINNSEILDVNTKVSTDVILNDKCLIEKYFTELRKCSNLYIEKYFYSSFYGKWTVNETVNIQHYNPGEGFFAWHTERSSNELPNAYRHLVFMTYLNDIDDGGETEFFYQNVKFKPQKGKTLIWPADWTHTHRGITSLTEEKYIITGWFSYF